MRRQLILSAGFLVVASSALAGVRFGLGSAVANKAVPLFDQATQADVSANTGDNAAQSLPSCGTNRPYTVPITDLSVIAGVVPLGNLNPSGHTFPTDHIYFYMKPLDPSNPTGPRQTATVVAPGDVLVTEVATTEYLDAPTPFIDYSIYFYGCREVKSYVSHIEALDPVFAQKVGAITQDCSDYSTGGSRFRRCQQNLRISMSAGEPIGTSGPPHSVSFDFGTYDYRTSQPFLSPQRWNGDTLHTVCPVDYFEAGPKAQTEALLGRFDGGVRRTTAPVCGGVAFDIANTARGDWFKIGAPDNPQDPHLALVPDNVNPSLQDIASGTSVPNYMGWLTFTPTHAGRVNRDLAEVTADGNVYCYDSFVDPLGQPSFVSFRLLIQMPTPTTLRIERDDASNTCGAGPWSLTAAAPTFQR